MRRWLRWLVPPLLLGGTVAGGATAWRSEAAVARPLEATGGTRATTPVLSVRRLPAVLAAPIAARRLAADLDALTTFLPAGSCLVVEGPDLRYEHRPSEPVVPASTTKLLTATAALVSLDPDTRFRTTAVASATPAGGVLRGDLTLVGGGDPLLASADYMARFRRQPQAFTDLDALAGAIQAAGVQRIEGAVVGDEGRHDRARYVAGWPQRYLDQNVIGPLSALAVNDGFERYPTPEAPSVALAASPDPARTAAAVLTRLLEARGVSVGGVARAGAAPPDAVEVAGIDSAPLLDVVAQMLRESDNSTAELLLKELGRAAEAPTTAAGATAARAALDEGGVPLEGVALVDGSGLSLDDRVTCTSLVDVLGRPGTGPALVERLPVAGESGTLAERFRGTALEGVLRAKTGSLTSVSSLAGVVADEDPPLTFALVVNVPPPERVPAALDQVEQQIGEAMAAWPRTPDASVLGPVVAGG